MAHHGPYLSASLWSHVTIYHRHTVFTPRQLSSHFHPRTGKWKSSHVHVHWFTFRNHAVSNRLFLSVFHVRGDFWLGKCQRTENPALFWSAGHNLAMMVGWFLSFLRVISVFSNPVLSQPNGLGLLGRLQWLNSIFRVYNEFHIINPPTSFTLINRHNALSTFQETLTERNILLNALGEDPYCTSFQANLATQMLEFSLGVHVQDLHPTRGHHVLVNQSMVGGWFLYHSSCGIVTVKLGWSTNLYQQFSTSMTTWIAIFGLCIPRSKPFQTNGFSVKFSMSLCVHPRIGKHPDPVARVAAKSLISLTNFRAAVRQHLKAALSPRRLNWLLIAVKRYRKWFQYLVQVWQVPVPFLSLPFGRKIKLHKF